MSCYGAGGPSFSVLVYPSKQLVPCLALAEAAAWPWDRLPPQHTHQHTRYACCLLFRHCPPKCTLNPSEHPYALVYHCPHLPLLSRLRPQACGPRITHRSCPVVASAPHAPAHRLSCRNQPQGGLVHIGPSTSAVPQSCVKRLVCQWLREKRFFGAYFCVFIIANEVAHKDNNETDLLKKALYIHHSIFLSE